MSFVIYGAGSCGRDVRQGLEDSGERVLGFLDCVREEPIDVLSCVHPASEQATRWRESGARVVIAIWNPCAPIDEIEDELKAAGWAQVENFPRLRERYSGALGTRFWIGGHAANYQNPQTQRFIEEARRLWSDDKSRELFEIWLRARQDLDLAPLNRAWREEGSTQYFPRDVEGWPREIFSFVDCGAYDGDTLRELKQQLPDSEIAYYGFEPDKLNFERLSQEARTPQPHGAPSTYRCALWPCGVWHETLMLSFENSGLASSALAEGGSVLVPVVALDEVLQGVPIQVLKMDIEGAEPHALRGARRLISAQRPCLALCLYHSPEHLWSLPLMLDSWRLNYKFFLRAHAANGFDWICYAVPS